MTGKRQKHSDSISIRQWVEYREDEYWHKAISRTMKALYDNIVMNTYYYTSVITQHKNKV